MTFQTEPYLITDVSTADVSARSGGWGTNTCCGHVSWWSLASCSPTVQEGEDSLWRTWGETLRQWDSGGRKKQLEVSSAKVLYCPLCTLFLE